jgi:hypothetical protein
MKLSEYRLLIQLEEQAAVLNVKLRKIVEETLKRINPQWEVSEIHGKWDGLRITFRDKSTNEFYMDEFPMVMFFEQDLPRDTSL